MTTNPIVVVSSLFPSSNAPRADLFVLAAEFEGWADFLLEAVACGLRVVTTDVGGNREVVTLLNAAGAAGAAGSGSDKRLAHEAPRPARESRVDVEYRLSQSGTSASGN